MIKTSHDIDEMVKIGKNNMVNSSCDRSASFALVIIAGIIFRIGE